MVCVRDGRYSGGRMGRRAVPCPHPTGRETAVINSRHGQEERHWDSSEGRYRSVKSKWNYERSKGFYLGVSFAGVTLISLTLLLNSSYLMSNLNPWSTPKNQQLTFFLDLDIIPLEISLTFDTCTLYRRRNLFGIYLFQLWEHVRTTHGLNSWLWLCTTVHFMAHNDIWESRTISVKRC